MTLGLSLRQFSIVRIETATFPHIVSLKSGSYTTEICLECFKKNIVHIKERQRNEVSNKAGEGGCNPTLPLQNAPALLGNTQLRYRPLSWKLQYRGFPIRNQPNQPVRIFSFFSALFLEIAE